MLVKKKLRVHQLFCLLSVGNLKLTFKPVILKIEMSFCIFKNITYAL